MNNMGFCGILPQPPTPGDIEDDEPHDDATNYTSIVLLASGESLKGIKHELPSEDDRSPSVTIYYGDGEFTVVPWSRVVQIDRILTAE